MHKHRDNKVQSVYVQITSAKSAQCYQRIVHLMPRYTLPDKNLFPINNIKKEHENLKRLNEILEDPSFDVDESITDGFPALLHPSSVTVDEIKGLRVSLFQQCE
ncbi:hypothetical protein NE237_023977 [Protea cynaroides]|uniref:Uncharacterized protein n=1 Tax=Protea cynaroides TaxID=273540 RepID=A0A9Q0K6V5_9MAGN|nr:hypothetical protein NE237_023977 [Protea cynaroides]